MAIITVILLACIIYKAGLIRWFLNLLQVEDEPQPVEAEPPTLTPYEQHRKDREQWEADARYILTIQGKVNPETVRTMGDEMLIRIIRDYLDL